MHQKHDDTVCQGNSSKGAAIHSSTPSKNCEQNAVATLNDIVNVRHHVIKGEGSVFYANQVSKILT